MSLLIQLLIQAGQRAVKLLIQRFYPRPADYRRWLIGSVARNVQIERPAFVPQLLCRNRQMPDGRLAFETRRIDLDRFREAARKLTG